MTNNGYLFTDITVSLFSARMWCLMFMYSQVLQQVYSQLEHDVLDFVHFG